MVFSYIIASDEDCIRNGENTNTQNYQPPSTASETYSQYTTRKSNQVQQTRGLHETFDYYDNCYMRSRNRGNTSLHNMSIYFV